MHANGPITLIAFRAVSGEVRYRICSTNSRPTNNPSPPPPNPSRHLLILLSPPRQVEVESDATKLISDDSSSEN